ncbi:hypothetical protein U9M48_031165 [Paspalum notatum var. saurae]|uniref:Uncharacterized protein n=1 Tax=Paspalum notatum var. saurae TaxID=547442 RepID=A0AAQ3X3G2_PASNO
MYLARAFEARSAASPPPSAPRGARPPPHQGLPGAFRSTPGTLGTTAGHQQQSTAAPPPTQGPPRQFRRLSPAEQQERRRQGLCYNCDEPYVRGHICKRLFYLESADFTDDDVTADGSPPADGDGPADPEPADDTAPQPTVSLHAIAGVRTEHTMLLPVQVHGHCLVALLDSGSTSNFINADLLRSLHLPIDPRPAQRVLVANGDRVPCQGMARNVAITIGKEAFHIGCYGIALGEYDLILGVEFLRTLGPILWDFIALRMTFTRGSQHVQWDGLASHHDTPSGPTICATITTPDRPLLDSLLRQFEAVFQEPHGLPPAQPYDHRIHLLPGTAPVAVRPYRYPQLQKDELERQCATMLEQGIIRPSTSPFSVPVLLVCKADKSWRFCIDYRALNAKTSKDKFPIQEVDELLDELHGARFFTKLDLRSG